MTGDGLMASKRTVSRIIRLTEEENERIEELAAEHRISFSAYMRESALYRESASIPREMYNLMEELITQVKKIGVSINQIAHYCNANKEILKIEYERCTDLQRTIEKKVMLLIREIRSMRSDGNN